MESKWVMHPVVLGHLVNHLGKKNHIFSSYHTLKQIPHGITYWNEGSYTRRKKKRNICRVLGWRGLSKHNTSKFGGVKRFWKSIQNLPCAFLLCDDHTHTHTHPTVVFFRCVFLCLPPLPAGCVLPGQGQSHVCSSWLSAPRTGGVEGGWGAMAGAPQTLMTDKGRTGVLPTKLAKMSKARETGLLHW